MEPGDDDPFDRKFEYSDHFLGTSRGFTRQLRTTFAPPPEPPPPPRRLLRVLVVANPAADAPAPRRRARGARGRRRLRGVQRRVRGPVREPRSRSWRLIGPERGDAHRGARAPDAPPLRRAPLRGPLRLRRGQPGSRAGSSAATSGSRPTSSTGLTGCPSSSSPTPASRGTLRTAGPVHARPGAELRRVVLPPRRLQLRLHRLAGRRRRGAWSSRSESTTACSACDPKRDRAEFFRPVPPCRCTRRCARPGSGSPASPTACGPGGAYQHYGNPYFRFFDPEGMKTPPRKTLRFTRRGPRHARDAPPRPRPRPRPEPPTPTSSRIDCSPF